MSAISSFIEKPKMVKIKGVVQHYSWGGTQFITDLLSLENPDQKSHAEYWLGAHPKAPSLAETPDATIPLNQLIDNATEQVLGKAVVEKFGNRLPFLFKVLDARDMLSIQVHPSREQAKTGFERENQAGIPLDAPHRNYKDDNHKPEVHVALTDFWMLHSFREPDEIEHILTSTPEFNEFLPYYTDKDIKSLYSHIMQLSQADVDRILNPLINRLLPKYHNRELPRDNPDYWAVLASIKFPLEDGHRDRGIFSIYLFNLVHLKPGEGTFQDAGIPHAYLQGVNMELMASSDNVLRGGLTPKHIDVPELLNTLVFTGGHPQIIRGKEISNMETVYTTTAPDFELSRLQIDKSHRWQSTEEHGPEILLVLKGKVEVCGKNNAFTCHPGEAFFVPADLPYSLKTEQSALLYKASVPR